MDNYMYPGNPLPNSPTELNEQTARNELKFKKITLTFFWEKNAFCGTGKDSTSLLYSIM